MCEPTTLLTIATVAGTAMTAYSSVQQGKQAQKQGEFNAAVSSNNAIKAENRGVDKENAYRMQTQALRKEQEAQFGAANVQLGSGSAANILADTENLGEADALTIRNNAADEAANYRQDAEMSLYQGESAKQAGYMGAFSSALQGAGNVSSKWYSRRNSAAY